MVDIETNMKSLSSVAILEKDTNNDVFAVWSYPEMTTDFEKLIISRSNLSLDSIPVQFSFSRFKNEWIYIYIHLAQNRNVVAFAITLVANDFNPEKYLEFAKLLAQLYATTGDPVSVLECWLSVFTKGNFQGDKLGNFSVAEHDPRKALLATSIKDVIRMFGEEIILVWTALLMKKRVLVSCEKLGFLLKFIRALPLFVFYRQNWGVLRPYVNLNEEEEVNELKATGVYVAGVTTNSKDREDLYDLYIDVGNKSITIASHAKADFAMTNVHKDICEFLVGKVEESDQDIIKGLTLKTKELLGKLEQLKVEHEDGTYIDYKTLQNTKLPANMDRFLYAVATAEGMTKL